MEKVKYLQHPYYKKKVYFVTKHRKEEVLAPLFLNIGMTCEKVAFDTDQFGTFSGEILRPGTSLEALRLKVLKASEVEPLGNYFLASEGSFGPNPHCSYFTSDLESLLFWDKENNLEIYAEYLNEFPVNHQALIKRNEDWGTILVHFKLPEHAVIVHPQIQMKPIFKGLRTREQIQFALNTCFMDSDCEKVQVISDLRASFNLNRREAIYLAGQLLIKKILSLCPKCGCPGFDIAEAIPGLICSECERPGQLTKEVIWHCFKCNLSQTKLRPDGKISHDPEFCDYCNP